MSTAIPGLDGDNNLVTQKVLDREAAHDSRAAEILKDGLTETTSGDAPRFFNTVTEINDCNSPDDALRFMLDNPTGLVELLAADAAHPDGDPTLRNRAFGLLKDGTLDAYCRRVRGHSIWEPIFADLDRRYPTSESKAMWEYNRWPFYVERCRRSGLWVPYSMKEHPLVDHERARHFDRTELVGLAWFFVRDPRTFGLRSAGGIWHKMYDNRLYLAGAYDGSNSDYFARLSRLIGLMVDARHASEVAWWVLRREPWRAVGDDDKAAA